MQGIPASRMARFAAILSPIVRIDCGVGPMNAKPALSTCSAKSAFSARNPYPGWMACAPLASAASRMADTLR